MSPRHGTRSAYVAGCRCDACRAANTAANRERERRKLYGRPARVDAAPVREKVARLKAAGMGEREICRAAGVSRSWLNGVIRSHWRTGEPVEKCDRGNAERVLALKSRDLTPCTRVDAMPATAIVQTLWRAGLSVAEMSRACGVDAQVLYRLLHGKSGQCQARTLQALLAARAEMEARCPRRPGRYLATMGRKPRRGRVFSEGDKDKARKLVAGGASLYRVGQMFGVDYRVVKRWCA